MGSGVLGSNPTHTASWLGDLDLSLLTALSLSFFFCDNLMGQKSVEKNVN
jgi:hypothetical protein